VSGSFEIGLADHDLTLAFASLEDVAGLAGPAASAGVRVFYADPFEAPALTPRLAAALGTGAGTDWTVEHAAYFHAIRLEKTMMTVILLLIVAVAVFNVVASLVMVVSEKRNDIAILRTLGLSRGGVVATFIVQGTVIGWIGALAGIGLGVLLALNAGSIVHAFERWFGFELFDPTVYYISRIPSELRASDVALVSVTAFALTLLATVYPARRAAATEPAEALRYE
jgi:lipoprotein-releasing system permease protein